MRQINRTSEFKRCFKLLERRHWDLGPLAATIQKLANDSLGKENHTMTTPIKKLMLAMVAATAICLGAGAANEDKTWMVVDLRTGALSYYGYDLTTATNTFNTPLYKTEKMVFRRIPAGLYWVRDGAARAFMENDYYMAMFTVTVGQYAIITNSAAVVDQNDAENLKPQVEVAWQQWEGTSDLGNYFPNKASTGPIGQIEQRIHSNAPDTQLWLSMDLPTISMWEVAARAMPANDGSHKSWRWYFGETADDIDLYEWRYNAYGAIYKPVGSFLPNDWGFYDILGNGGQWCLDGIAEWPIGDEIYHYSQRPCRRAYSRGAAPYGWMSFWELKDDGERVLHEWGNDEAWGYRCYCGDAIEDSSAIGFHEICSSLGQNFSDRPTWRSGARLAIVCRNEVSAPPVTVTWQDDDGNVLEVDAVPFGTMPSYGGVTPTKPSTVYDTYEFTGWTPQIGLAVSNTTYTAQFHGETIYYTTKWLNWDGTELYTYSFNWYGNSPVYDGPAPTKPPTVEYEYTFTGWNPEPAAVTGETTYVAQFMQSARKYDITWLNYDGSTNATTRTPYNTTPEFVGETPAKPSTVQYAYSFAGWTPELEPATSNAAYTAVFDESIREYPVKFYNNTGSELLFTTNVPYGSTPEYLGETPTNPSTAQYHYSFAGWGRDMRVVDGPSFYNDYYAEFDPILRSYDITFANYDGTVLCVTNVPYGTTPAYNGATPTKPATDTTRFIFSGWTQAVVPVTGATTYTAKFDEYVFLINLSTLTAAYTAIDGDILTNATSYGVSIADGATVTLAEMSSPGLTCLGNATIIIADDTENTLSKTLSIGGSGTSLVIEGSTGKLTVNGSIYTPAIGNGGSDSGDIVVNGGTIEANGTYQASGIGCAGDITINGGNITATGHEAPGIGMRRGGSQNCGNITISGGIVNAVGTCSRTWNGVYHYNLFAIGGYCGEIRIESTITKVVATIDQGGYPIGTVDSPVIIAESLKQALEGNTLTIENLPSYDITWLDEDGTLLATGKAFEGDIPVYGGAMPVKDRYVFTGWIPTLIPATGAATYTAKYDVPLIDLSTLTAAYTAIDGDILTNATSYGVSIADGATVTLAGMSSPGLTCLGNATIVIADNTVNTLSDTLRAGGTGTTLTIQGNTGTLTANGGWSNAGIGGKGQACGNIRIEGGVINAIGGNQSAGIGPYFSNKNTTPCGDITITGGTVTAVGNEWGAGIGSSCSEACGKILISGGFVTATGGSTGPGIGGSSAQSAARCESITISGGTVFATTQSNRSAIGWNCGDIRIDATIAKVVATVAGGTPISSNNGTVTIAESLKQALEGNTLTIEPDVKETAVTVGGAAVGEVVRGEDGRTLSFAVAAGTVAGDVKLDIGGVDVTKGFRVTVNGTEARAVLLAPYEVPKEEGAADEPWTDNGDGNVTLNVEVVPGLYYAADSAESLDALACPGASAPATGATTLTAPKPAGGTGFFKVWVSDAPIPVAP